MSDFVARAMASRREMRAVFAETPLQKNEYLSARYAANIYLKREDLSPVRSYKIRGAFNAMRKNLDETPDRNRFVCASAGNHAQGVAFMCKHFSAHGVIFMPVTTPQQKIDKTKAFGGSNIEIQLVGDYFENTLAAAISYCAAENATFLSPFDDLNVIEGQASVAVEMLEQCPESIDIVVLPGGCGGLSAGVVTYLNAV